MDISEPFNLITFTDTTKKVCTYSAITIFLILIFIISPLSNLFLLSTGMKLIIIILLLYILYLNLQQTEYLRKASTLNVSRAVSKQLNINIISSYVFTLFIGLLVIFVIKSFF